MEILEDKVIIVIGGAGFVGSHLCDFLKTDNTVTSLDNYLSGDKDNHVPGVTYIEGSSLNISELAGELSPDIIFHLGEYSRVESSFDDYDLVIQNNLVPFSAVLNFAKDKNAKLIYSGSSTKFANYGVDDVQSPYAWVKAKNTEHLINYARWFSLEYAIVYFYNVYGGNEIGMGPFSTVIAKFKRLYLEGERVLPVVSPGTQVRNFTHYSDIVNGLVTVALRGYGDGFGIGNEHSISMLELVSHFGCSPDLVPSRRGNRESATLVTSATQALGWLPKVDIVKYLARFIRDTSK
jgi:UDP-glucose 4-epimerase